MQHFALLLSLLQATSLAWIFESNVKEIVPGTSKNVQLVCRNYGPSFSGQSSGIKQLSRIQINKRDPFGDKFKFADVSVLTNTMFQADGKIIVSSNTVANKEIFLKVTWATATKNTAGVYDCEVFGFNKENNFVSSNFTPLLIKEKSLTMADVAEQIQKLTLVNESKQQSLESEIEKLKQELKEVKQKSQISSANLKSDLEKLKKDVNSKFVSKDTLSMQISNMRNFTVDEISVSKQTHDKKFDGLNLFLQNKFDVCQANYSSLSSSQEQFQDFIFNETVITESKFSSVLTNLSSVIESIESKYNNDTELLRLEIAKCSCSATTLTIHEPKVTPVPSQITPTKWPSGLYSLIKSRMECPKSGQSKDSQSFWVASADINIQAEDKTNKLPFHEFFSMKIISTNVTWTPEYCMKFDSQSDDNIPWPAGSYCIDSYQGTCPKNFRTMYIGFYVRNSQMHVYYNHFCCRSDGSVDRPIKLPSSQAFYLYRYSVKCQAVEAMEVTEDRLIVSPRAGVNLHVQIRGHYKQIVKMETLQTLCFYKPSR